MLNAILRVLFGALLSLRYRIEVVGLDRLAPKDHRGMLFLPNHPALIDPVIILRYLTARFPVRALAGKTRVDTPFIRWLGQRVNVRTIVDADPEGNATKRQIAGVMRDVVHGLRNGEALVLYPAGRVYRQRLENLRSNSAVEFLARACPEIRVVLVRTQGLWGSSFGRASGKPTQLGAALLHGAFGLLMSGIFFAPRRHLRIEFSEPGDFPRGAGRQEINRYLESFYNTGALPNTYVPYSLWERGGTRVLPEPKGETLDE
jgi:1-acyl-sn-glycerol-3-phosphate acyltransferase